MIGKSNIVLRATAVLAVAVVVISCKGKLGKADQKDLDSVPVQVVNKMFVIQSDKGLMQLRAEAQVMERYQTDTLNYEMFPRGFVAYFYDEKGNLETRISADQARHNKFSSGQETWMAFNNVIIRNVIKNETMETDTLYWDKENEKIYTECYVQMYSPSGFMQGYGMESDQRGRNSVITRPFNSYGIVQQDTTAVVIDSVNFIGPFPKNQ